MRTVKAAPRAAVLIESMRDIGYSLESALADIIDNSITANASQIQLFADTLSSDVKIGVLDDGAGMSESTLLEAMRPGSRSPREKRAGADLGRFGLGLKTASFSQCRRLTVVSRVDGTTSIARWDLDYVIEADEWLVQIPENINGIPWADRLSKSGTLVVWEKMDRLAGDGDTAASNDHIVSLIDNARSHLELVFHRFLAGDRGIRKIDMALNELPLVPFDPFHSSHASTMAGPSEEIKVDDYLVSVQQFTLPHHQKVSTSDWERYAGREGYLRNQGFYLYRERRLIIYGTWFRLARQTELTKLARVRIDMPNDLDAAWKIDVKKSSAQPPYQVRDRLQRIIEQFGAPSRTAYTTRGRRLVDQNRLPVWSRIQDDNAITYRINQDHPVVADFSAQLETGTLKQFQRILEIAGSALPVDTLFADMGNDPDKVAGNSTSDETLAHAAITTYSKLIDSDWSSDDVLTVMQAAEPFRSNWKQVEKLISEFISSGVNNG